MKYSRLDRERAVMNAESELLSLGIPLSQAGFGYLLDALDICLMDARMLNLVTKGLYMRVGRRNHVSADCVEVSIRRAIQAAWRSDSGRMRSRIFEFSGGLLNRKPTNTELICLLLWYGRRDIFEHQNGEKIRHEPWQANFVAQEKMWYNDDSEIAEGSGGKGEGRHDHEKTD